MNITLKETARELGLKKEGSYTDRTDYYCERCDQETGDLSVYHGSHFACHGEGGESPATLVMHVKNWDSVEKAVDWLEEHFPDKFQSVDREDFDRKRKAVEVLSKAADLASDRLLKQKPQVLEDLKEKRSFDQETVEQAKIGHLSSDDVEILKKRFEEQALLDSGLFGEEKDTGEIYSHLGNRIVYPYLRGESTVFMIGRRLPDSGSEAKYKKAYSTDHIHNTSYELHRKDEERVIITEGVTDAISAWKAGFNVVSPVTTRFSNSEVENVAEKVGNYDKVFIGMDSDGPGQEGQVRTAEELVRKGLEPYLVTLPDGMDLDDWTSENSYDIQPLIDEAENYLDQLIERAKETDDRKETIDKTEKVLELVEDWDELKREPILKDLPVRKGLLEKKLDNKKDGSDTEKEQNKQKRLSSIYGAETIQKAKHLLEEEHILKKVKTVLDHRIAGEDINKMGIFLQLLSKDTDKPLMIFGIQKQGEGKSYIAKNVIELFPDRMVKDVTDMTKAALYRRAQDKPEYFDGKIVFFGEIPEDDDDRKIFQIFRQLVSEGEVSKELVIEEGGQQKPVELRLEGSPALLSTTINPGIIDEQDMSRGMAYSPEMSEEQNEKVRSFQNRERELPEEVIHPSEIDELEEVIKCALDILSRDKVNLQNPFTRDMDNEIPEDTDNIKRDYPKTLRIATEMPTYLYHRQRPKKELKDTQYTFVTWKDVARGVVINRKFINNLIRGRTESAMDAYQAIKENVAVVEKSYDEMEDYVTEPDIGDEDSFTNQDLEKWMGVAGQTAREYTRKLDRMELIFKNREGRPHKHYLVDESKSETAGITLRSLHNIITSVFNREALGEWARDYIKYVGLEGKGEEILERIGFSEEDLPIELDLGMEPDDSLPTPIYMDISDYKVEVATSLKVEIEGSNIICRFGSVNKTFSGEKNSAYEEVDPEPEKVDSSGGRTRDVSEEELVKALKKNNGVLHYSEIEELNYDADTLESIARDSDKVEKGFGTPEGDNVVENRFELAGNAEA